MNVTVCASVDDLHCFTTLNAIMIRNQFVLVYSSLHLLVATCTVPQWNII